MNLDSLYRSLILEHAKNPKHKGLKGYKSSHLRNPSCGDEITIEALINDKKVMEVNHDGHGCSICCASASILCELTSNKELKQVEEIIEEYYKMLKGLDFNSDILEDAIAFKGISLFPARYKCASIAWQALSEVLGEEDE